MPGPQPRHQDATRRLPGASACQQLQPFQEKEARIASILHERYQKNARSVTTHTPKASARMRKCVFLRRQPERTLRNFERYRTGEALALSLSDSHPPMVTMPL